MIYSIDEMKKKKGMREVERCCFPAEAKKIEDLFAEASMCVLIDKWCPVCKDEFLIGMEVIIWRMMYRGGVLRAEFFDER